MRYDGDESSPSPAHGNELSEVRLSIMPHPVRRRPQVEDVMTRNPTVVRPDDDAEPLLVLFELSVLLARIFERRRESAPDERWDLDDDLSLS